MWIQFWPRSLAMTIAQSRGSQVKSSQAWVSVLVAHLRLAPAREVTENAPPGGLRRVFRGVVRRCSSPSVCASLGYLGRSEDHTNDGCLSGVCRPALKCFCCFSMAINTRTRSPASKVFLVLPPLQTSKQCQHQQHPHHHVNSTNQ